MPGADAARAFRHGRFIVPSSGSCVGHEAILRLASPARERQTRQLAGHFGHFTMAHRVTLLAIDGCFASSVVGTIDMLFAALAGTAQCPSIAR